MSMLRMRAPLNNSFGHGAPQLEGPSPCRREHTTGAPFDLAACARYAAREMHRQRARRSARGLLWMAAYVVCVVLVVSFIFFEVLDVDGSDFASPMHAAATIKATDPPGDLRRT